MSISYDEAIRRWGVQHLAAHYHIGVDDIDASSVDVEMDAEDCGFSQESSLYEPASPAVSISGRVSRDVTTTTYERGMMGQSREVTNDRRAGAYISLVYPVGRISLLDMITQVLEAGE